MFRKTLLAAALLSLPAFADFSGGYVGAFAGNQSATDDFHSDETSDLTTVEPSGSVYGFMIGFNHQDGNFVVGTEFEFGLSSTDETLLTSDPTNNFGYDIADEIGGAMRLRARFGYVVGESFLPFLAVGVSSITTTISADGFDEYDVNRIGFSMGAGLDWQMNDTWSFRAEYFTEDFGSAIYNSYNQVGDTWDMNLSMDTFRVGASMHF